MSATMPTRVSALAGGLLAGLSILFCAASVSAQDPQSWQRSGDPRYQQSDDIYRPPYDSRRYDDPRRSDAYSPSRDAPNDAYSPRTAQPKLFERDPNAPSYGSPAPSRNDAYQPPRAAQGYGQPYYPPQPSPGYGQPYPNQAREGYGQTYASPPPRGQYGQPYTPGPDQAYDSDPQYRGYGPPPGDDRYSGPPRYDNGNGSGTYSSNEILSAGHSFFGSVSKGLASVVEYAFKNQGRPNGYILGQDAGGAFVAGLRYGEGTLYTKDAGTHRVYWQGPSIGYDLGAEGSKVMVLVYNLADPQEIYQRFGGVDGSAYIVGGVGLTFQKSGEVIVAPIRAGVGLRLGANIGYLKYTREPTWNPF
jgi:hypothetical protein